MTGSLPSLEEKFAAARGEILDSGARILTIDIERLPGLAYVWEPKTRYIPARNFKEWPSLLCFAARWYGDRSFIFESLWGSGKEQMVARAWELYDQADIVITYNGVRFDNKHLKSDWLEAGMAPPSPWKDIDLFQQVKQFGFESKSLDTVTRRLGRPGKETFYDMEGAFAAVEGDRKAARELEEYNCGDVELTEWLHDRMLGWMPGVPHKVAGGAVDADGVAAKACNQCGSGKLELVPEKKYRAIMLDYALYRCAVCSGLSRAGWTARAASTRGVR